LIQPPQIQKLTVDIKSARRRRGNSSNPRSNDDARSGEMSLSPNNSPKGAKAGNHITHLPERNQAALRPPARPGTAVDGRRAAPKVYGSIVRSAPPVKTAWETNGGAATNFKQDLRQRRTHKIALGNLDKEAMQDRITALQRQVN
jgi:hypothetical protein